MCIGKPELMSFPPRLTIGKACSVTLWHKHVWLKNETSDQQPQRKALVLLSKWPLTPSFDRCTHTHLHKHTHMHAHTHTHTDTQKQTHTNTRPHTHTHTIIHTDTHTCMHTHTHAHTQTHTQSYTHTHRQTHTSIHMHWHTHTHNKYYWYSKGRSRVMLVSACHNLHVYGFSMHLCFK